MAVTARRIACAALAAALLLAMDPAAARRPGGARHDGLVPVQSADIGPAAAAAAARSATGGTVLGVRASQSGGRVIYRVKVLLPGGLVRTISVDGASGQVLG